MPIPTKYPATKVPLAEALRARVVGQDDALDAIAPYIDLYEAGLSPENRPVGVFMLLGPTGSGKTKTVEALADVIHGTERSMLTINCGEFQMEHEVAKLIGAPPGYLGHRETQPMITQQRLNATTSEHSGLSIVLFDEIEKAAPSMGRLLLGVLDKAILKLGDNTSVNFGHSLIFMTSNLGAREMESELTRRYGLAQGDGSTADYGRLSRMASVAVKRRFSPEFMNRIDQVLTYHPLTTESIAKILEFQIAILNKHLSARLGPLSFTLKLDNSAAAYLLDRGVSPEYGARELKRMIHKYVLQPLAQIVLRQVISPGATVTAARRGKELHFLNAKGQEIKI